MAELPFSRFKLKRSASVDSIQTGLNNLISRLHFSQLLQRGPDTLEDDDCIIDNTCKLSFSISDFNASSSAYYNTVSELSTERNCSLMGDRRHKDERISSDFPNIQKQENKTRPSNEGSRKKLPRRCSSYYDEYSKRESDRQKAREVAASLIRAHKVKKEFSDGIKSSSYSSPTKSSRKKLQRRSSKVGASPTKAPFTAATTTTTTATIYPVGLAPKIRLHTTTTALSPLRNGISSSRTNLLHLSP
jgi:hypothetical protein